MINTHVVIDLGFGDSGKGMVVSTLCSNLINPLVVRFSGGHQAGHNVQLQDGTQHVFTSFGSGTFQGAPTFWSKECTFHPNSFINEFNILSKKTTEPIKIYIDSECPITTPYELEFNKTMDRFTGHGSCGVGFGATIEREENNYHLHVGDLLFPSAFKIKFDALRDFYKPMGFRISEDEISIFEEDCKECLKHISISQAKDIPQLSKEFSDLVFEGSQGLLLDKDIGFFPNVTRGNVGISQLQKIFPDLITNLYYVTRAYQTRHGNGPLTGETFERKIKRDPREQNNDSGFQGTFRTGILDVDLLKYAIYKNELQEANIKNRNMVVTCLDHIEESYRFLKDGKLHIFANEEEFMRELCKSFFLEEFQSFYTSNNPYPEWKL